MSRAVLIDTGPLVALYNPRDAQHERCRDTADRLRMGAITTWPVLTEAAYLLRRYHGAIQLLANDVAQGVYIVATLDAGSFAWMTRFMETYGSIGAELADASLMWLGEHQGLSTIFTLDRRDFSVYRFSSGAAPDLLP